MSTSMNQNSEQEWSRVGVGESTPDNGVRSDVDSCDASVPSMMPTLSPIALLCHTDLLRHILTFVGDCWILTQVHAVCRLWRDVCADLPLRLDYTLCTMLTHRARLFRTADAITKARWLVEVAQRSHLTTIALLGCCVGSTVNSVNTAATIIPVLKVCPNLTEFTVPEMSTPGCVLSTLGLHCRHLERLVIAGPSQPASIPDADFHVLLQHCRELSSISLHDTGDDAAFIGMANGSAKNGRLGQLDLFHWEADCVLTDVGVTTVASVSPNLTDIRLCSDTLSLGDPSIIALAHNCVGLTAACFKGSGDGIHITDAGMAVLAERCQSLVTLQVCGSVAVTDASLAALADGCPLLENVDFSHTSVTDDGVATFARQISGLARVHLCGTHITDHAVLVLLDRCPGLFELGLSHCSHLTDATVDSIIAHGAHGRTLHGLDSHQIYDGWCAGFTDAAIQRLEDFSDQTGGIFNHYLFGDASNSVFS